MNSTNSNPDSDEFDILRQPSSSALADLFTKYQQQLERMGSFRLDQRLYGRVDSTDELQEAYVEISRRINEFLGDLKTTFFCVGQTDHLADTADDSSTEFRSPKARRRARIAAA